MKIKSILAAIIVMACSSVFAQNATKAELDALSQRVSKLEADLERVITENVNLVEQLKIKTVTSVTDDNGIQWDIVKVQRSANDVKIVMRINNNTGVERNIYIKPDKSFALDTNSNQQNNKYTSLEGGKRIIAPNGTPVNTYIILEKVPITTSYLSIFHFIYSDFTTNEFDIPVKFTGIHIPR